MFPKSSVGCGRWGEKEEGGGEAEGDRGLEQPQRVPAGKGFGVGGCPPPGGSVAVPPAGPGSGRRVGTRRHGGG